jgi:hypothetical protein
MVALNLNFVDPLGVRQSLNMDHGSGSLSSGGGLIAAKMEELMGSMIKGIRASRVMVGIPSLQGGVRC